MNNDFRKRAEKQKENLSIKTDTEVRKNLIEYKKTLKKNVLTQYDIREIGLWTLVHDSGGYIVKEEKLNGIFFDVVDYFFDLIEDDITINSGVEATLESKIVDVNGNTTNKRKNLLKKREYLLSEIENVEKELKDIGVTDFEEE